MNDYRDSHWANQKFVNTLICSEKYAALIRALGISRVPGWMENKSIFSSPHCKEHSGYLFDHAGKVNQLDMRCVGLPTFEEEDVLPEDYDE